jgi:hypothetical protein
MEIFTCNLLEGYQHFRGTCWFHLVWPYVVIICVMYCQKPRRRNSLVQDPYGACAVTGVVVMEGFRIVFNQSSKTIGFAKSVCGPAVSLSGPFETETGGLSKSFHGLCLLCSFSFHGLSMSYVELRTYLEHVDYSYI